MLLSICDNFARQHPLFIFSVYWLAGLVAPFSPGSSILLLIFLMPFMKKNSSSKMIGCFFFFLIPLTFSTLNNKGSWNTFQPNAPITNSYNYSKTQHPCFKRPLSKTSSALCNKQYKNPIIQNLNTRKKSFLKKAYNDLQQNISNPQVISLISSLLFGINSQEEVQAQFIFLGVYHLLVISGFHFCSISRMLSLATHQTPKKRSVVITQVFLTFFMFTAPFSPSVIRAWVVSIIHSFSQIFRGFCSSLNALGLSLIICSLLFKITSLSLILSFLATMGILLYYPFFKNLLLKLIPQKIPLGNMLTSSLSLTISAHILLLPILFKTFGKVSLNISCYNLFIPPLLLPVFFLSFTALISHLPALYKLTELYTQKFLALVFSPHLPAFQEVYLPTTHPFIASVFWITFYTASLTLLGILISSPLKQESPISY